MLKIYLTKIFSSISDKQKFEQSKERGTEIKQCDLQMHLQMRDTKININLMKIYTYL